MREYDPNGHKARYAEVASSAISFDASETIRGVYDDVRLEAAR